MLVLGSFPNDVVHTVVFAFVVCVVRWIVVSFCVSVVDFGCGCFCLSFCVWFVWVGIPLEWGLLTAAVDLGLFLFLELPLSA